MKLVLITALSAIFILTATNSEECKGILGHDKCQKFRNNKDCWKYERWMRRKCSRTCQYCDQEPECNLPLNVQMVTLQTLSIYSLENYPLSKDDIRLNSSGGYRAEKSNEISLKFVEVTFKKETIITGVATQGYGNPNDEEWITTYLVTLDDDKFLLGSNGRPKEFVGNSDWNTIVRHRFPAENVRKVSIRPQTFHNNVAFRFELYGCTMKKSVILWLKWTNESCTFEMLQDKRSDGFESINAQLQSEEFREISNLPGVQVVKLEHLRPGSLIVELKIGMDKESQMQEMINGIKKTITNSSKFDSNYLVVKDLQGSFSCKVPNISFVNLTQIPQTTTEILRSSSYDIKALVKSRNRIRKMATVTWRIFHLRNSHSFYLDWKSVFESSQVFKQEEVALRNETLITWEILPFALINGLHYIELTVQMSNASNCVDYKYGFLRVKAWSNCTRHFNGIQMQTRECVNPKPQFVGIPCKVTVMRGCTNTSSCPEEFLVRFQTEGSPSTGVMQIQKNNTWKALCTGHWNNTEAILACQVNGYNYSNDNFTGNWKRGNTSLVNITSHFCSSIGQSCGLINKRIQCSVPVRLIGAKVEYGGRVEVFYRRRWGKICRNKWDIYDVKVVCKQLGFRGALAEFMTGMNTTDENIPAVMSDIACTGQESVLAQCNRLDGERNCPDDIGAQALCVPNNVEVLEMKSLSSNLGSTETVKCSFKTENQNEREIVKWYEIGTTASELNPDGRIEVKGATLTIKNVQLDDGGTYECRGQRYTRFYTVYVNARFKDKKTLQPLIYGKPGKVSCTAEGNPRPEFEWSKNDSLLLKEDRFTQLSDGSLQIDKVRREDKGAYKCSIKQTKGSERITDYSQVINVSLIVPPKVQVSKIPHNVLEGDNITLNCTVVDGLPKPQIRWFKSKLPLTEGKEKLVKSYVTEEGEGKKEGKLVKSYVTEEGEGTYTCVAKNEGGAANDSIYIVVDAPPKLDAALKKDSMLVLFHSTLQLKCIERGDPEPNVTWTNNGTQVANKNTLVITNVTFKDAGQYGCVAKNRAGNVSGKIWIEVIVAPVVYVSPQNQTVVEGQTTNISCKASGVPHPKLSWKFENTELPRDAVIANTSNQSLLQLPKTAKNMEGWYKCIAKNEAGEEYSNSSLHVLEFPTAEISPNPYPTMLEGDKLTLTCKANEATWRITWEKNNVSKIQRANITENGDSSILLIEKVQVSDSGKYSCKVLNKAGSASSSVDIKIRGHQEQNSPKTIPAARAIEWYYIVGPFSAVVLSALIIWYLCKRRMTAMFEDRSDSVPTAVINFLEEVLKITDNRAAAKTLYLLNNTSFAGSKRFSSSVTTDVVVAFKDTDKFFSLQKILKHKLVVIVLLNGTTKLADILL
ncbi:uncharacterized protein [Montipora foliosa]|uniref:uncharacterized protein n=1 Tax=Montipora foliosa TaxID=591990 RepID=UPI0035F104A0